MSRTSVSQELRSFCERFLAVDEQGEPLAGRFTITGGRNRARHSGKIAPVWWLGKTGEARKASEVIAEVQQKASRVQSSSPDKTKVYVNAYFENETSPEDWFELEALSDEVVPDFRDDVPAPPTEAAGAASQMAWALTRTNLALIEQSSDAQARADRLQERLLETTVELRAANIAVSALELHSGTDRDWLEAMKALEPALTAAAPMLAPALVELLSRAGAAVFGEGSKPRPAPASSGTEEPTHPGELLGFLLDRMASDFDRAEALVVQHLGNDEVVTPALQLKLFALLAKIDAARHRAGLGDSGDDDQADD